MGLFSRKIDKVSAEEERYRAVRAAAADREQATYTATVETAREEAFERVRARRDEWATKRARVKTVGQIKKTRRGYVTTGWEIAFHGSGRGRVAEDQVVHTGTLAGFTPAELCRIAHGSGCRCCS
jgi:phage protein D